MKAFYVYMMTNRSRVVLYTGITNSLMRRVWQHQKGQIEGFTKTYKVNRLIYYERFNDPRDAIAGEKEIKGWRREKKNALVETMNPKWADLSLMLFFFFFPPLIEMVAFGYALDNDVKHMALIILNEDRTVESRQLIDRFVNTETFRVVGEVQSLDALKSEMRKGRAYAALEIPPNFTRDLNAGHSAQVQLLVDGSNSTTALQALNTGLGVALTQSVESLLRETGRQGVPIDIRPQMLYNPAMRAPNFFVPGVIGVVLQIGTTVAAAMALVRERERGTLEQLLVSP